jgi:hypothetical protein
MEESGGPWAADRPYIIGSLRRNGWPHLNVYLAQIMATQRFGAFNGSIAQ